MIKLYVGIKQNKPSRIKVQPHHMAYLNLMIMHNLLTSGTWATSHCLPRRGKNHTCVKAVRVSAECHFSLLVPPCPRERSPHTTLTTLCMSQTQRSCSAGSRFLHVFRLFVFYFFSQSVAISLYELKNTNVT